MNKSCMWEACVFIGVLGLLLAFLQRKSLKEGLEAEIKPAEVPPAEGKPAEVPPAEGKPAEVPPAEGKPAPVTSSR